MVEYGAPVRPRPRGRLASPSCWSRWRCWTTPSALILCNGYKDRALHRDGAARAEARPPRRSSSIDRFGELDTHPRAPPRELGIRPAHRRARPAHAPRAPASGSSRPATAPSSASPRPRSSTRSTGCAAEDMLDCLELLHFHIGSQITAHPRRSRTRCARRAASSSSCTRWARTCATSTCGGGLGVDYDGSQTNFHSSMNYTLQEYANDVVARSSRRPATRAACRTRTSSPSRAARWSRTTRCSIFDVLGVERDARRASRRSPSPRTSTTVHPAALRDLRAASRGRTSRRPTTTRSSSRKRRSPLFNLGYLDLRARARVEQLFWAAARRSCSIVRELPYVPDELEGAREGARRHLLRQLLGLPVGARPLGGEAALPDRCRSTA